MADHCHDVPPPPPPDELPPPPPEEDAAPPPPPSDAGDTAAAYQYQTPDEYAAACAAYLQACKDAGYDVAHLTPPPPPQQQQPATRPAWLQELTEDSSGRGRRSRSPSPERGGPVAPQRHNGGRERDDRRGYAQPEASWRPPISLAQGRTAPRYGSTGPGMPPPGPRQGLFLQRCPLFQGGKGKCKRGQRCQFAHGDAELAPKEVRQRIRQGRYLRPGAQPGWAARTRPCAVPICRRARSLRPFTLASTRSE